MSLGIIGMVLAIAVMIIGAYRGIKAIPLTVLASLVVILFNGMPFWGTMDDPEGFMHYARGFGDNMGRFLFIFLASAVYAAAMEKTGSAAAIGQQLIKWFGTKHVLWIVYVFCVILTYGGLLLFVCIFVVVPVAFALFKEAKLPRHLVMAPFAAGGATITMTMLPGTPQLANVVTGTFLGTPATSAPLFGLIFAAATVGLTAIYFNWAVKDARRKNESFEFPQGFDAASLTIGDRKLPHPVKAFLPIITLLLFIIVSSVVHRASVDRVDAEIARIVYEYGIYTVIDSAALPRILAPWASDGMGLTILAVLVATVLCLVLNVKNINGPMIQDMTGDGAAKGIFALLGLVSVIAFGRVVSNAPVFENVIAWLLGLEINTYLKAVVSTSIISGIVGSSSGGLTITLENLAPYFIATATYGSQYYQGINLPLLHRIMTIAAGTLDTLPHVSAIFLILSVIGCTHKEAYRHMWWTTVVIPTVLLAIALVPIVLFFSPGAAAQVTDMLPYANGLCEAYAANGVNGDALNNGALYNGLLNAENYTY